MLLPGLIVLFHFVSGLFEFCLNPKKIQPKSANRSNLQECHCWLLPQVTLSKVTQDESRSPLLDLSRLSSDPGRGAKHGGGERSRGQIRSAGCQPKKVGAFCFFGSFEPLNGRTFEDEL